LGGNVRKGEHGELVVYANTISRSGTHDKGEEVERQIPFLKGYTCTGYSGTPTPC
jgi:antirestriction protein ArdC